MKFSQMKYVRPDIEKIRSEAAAFTSELTDAIDFDHVNDVFTRYEKFKSGYETAVSLAYVRQQIDTEDEFYDKEVAYIDEIMPLLEELDQEFSKALYFSPFRAQLEEKYGSLYFKNIGIQLKAFSPEIIPELQQENALVTEYGKLIASAQIPFDGGVYTLSQLTPMKLSPDDAKRLAAWKAEGDWYDSHRAELDGLYDKLTHLRDGMAKKLGYKSFTELGYYRMMRNSYTKEEVEKFRAAVVKYIVPLADEIMRRQAKRIGVSYPLNFADMALEYRSGNAKPQGSAEDIIAQGKRFYDELSPETSEFFSFMVENELFDLLSKKGKAGGGFCTEFPDYKCPFIFANFNGTQGDVEVITHEAGHAFAFYTARDIFPMELSSPTLESCEIHSMSMEFFAWPWAEGFFGPDTQKFYYGHMASGLTFLPYGTMVDHFQHEVYEHPDYTPEQRHDIWRELLTVYMPWVKRGDIPFYGDGRGWQRQKHIYESPFYYIDYCLAQSVALQFWALMMKDRKDAWERYIKLVRFAGTKTYTELVLSAGLSSPFGDEGLAMVAETAANWLAAFDEEKLK